MKERIFFWMIFVLLFIMYAYSAAFTAVTIVVITITTMTREKKVCIKYMAWGKEDKKNRETEKRRRWTDSCWMLRIFREDWNMWAWDEANIFFQTKTFSFVEKWECVVVTGEHFWASVLSSYTIYVAWWSAYLLLLPFFSFLQVLSLFWILLRSLLFLFQLYSSLSSILKSANSTAK